MGLYLSAHPLDKYDTYFSEQTHPMELITPENNGKVVTIGGIITNVRTILTKKGDKMAFVKIEDKMNETEFIVFPSVFAEHGAKLEVDNVVKVQGKINATDKDGNLNSEAKVMAEIIELISDDVLESYKSTGTKLAAPAKAPEKSFRRGSRTSAERVYRNENPKTIDTPRVLTNPPKDPRKEKLYVLVENPDDIETLTAIRRLADLNLGFQDMILVFKDGETKRPLKMPFRVDANEELVSKLKDLLGEDKVKIK